MSIAQRQPAVQWQNQNSNPGGPAPDFDAPLLGHGLSHTHL